MLWVGFEDSWPEVVLPRLVAAGADVERVFNLRVATPGQYLELARDRQALAELVDRHEVRVVAFEAIVDHLAGVDDHKNAEVRRGLTPVVELARERQLLVLGTTHLNKTHERQLPAPRRRLRRVPGRRPGRLARAPPPRHPELRVLASGKGNLGTGARTRWCSRSRASTSPTRPSDEVADVGRVAADPEPYFGPVADRRRGARRPEARSRVAREDDVTRVPGGVPRGRADARLDVYEAAAGHQ